MKNFISPVVTLLEQALSRSVFVIVFLAVLAMGVLVFFKLGCRASIPLPVLSPTKAQGGPGTVETTADKVVYRPAASKANPHPAATQIPKAPDDKVDVSTDSSGNVHIEVERLSWIFEPTVGLLWNGSFSAGSGGIGDLLEPELGVRMAKFSNLGLGPFITPERVGGKLDYREGNVTGAIGLGVPFGSLSVHVVVAVDAVPFD